MPEKTEKPTRGRQKKRESVNTRPSVAKKDPQAALKDLFTEHLGTKSPLLKAFEDNPIIDALEEHSKLLTKQQKDLKTVGDSNKILVKNILTSSTKLATIAKSLENFSDAIKSGKFFPKTTKETPSERYLKNMVAHFRANSATISRLANNFKDVRSTLVKQHKYNIDRDLHRESAQFESRKGGISSGITGFTPTKGLGYLENRSAQLFGKGFHFITGALSEIINKKILNNPSPYIQENLPRRKQSLQHQSYLETKGQLGALFGIFRIFSSDNKKVDKTVKVGNEKVAKSVDSMHTTLKQLMNHIVIQNQIIQDEAEEAKLHKTNAAREVVKAGNVVYAGGRNDGGGVLGSILNATKALGEIAAKVIPQIIPLTKNLLTGVRALALRPIGFAAGMGVIGGAAVGAAYYMDKTSRSMMEAQTEEIKSAAGVEMQRNRMKRANPQAYQLTRMKERLGELKMLPQTPANKKAQDELFKQYLDILNSNAVTPSPEQSSAPTGEAIPSMSSSASPTEGTPTIKKVSSVPTPTTTTETAEDLSGSVDEMHDGVVSELRGGKMVDVLTQIRDKIDNLGTQGAASQPQGSPLDTDLITFNSKSTIANQRDAMRSVP